jgi:hypothetical protein
MDYKGVNIIINNKDKRYPYTGQGVVWSFDTLENLQNYIDKSINGGKTQVDNGSLVFVKL